MWVVQVDPDTVKKSSDISDSQISGYRYSTVLQYTRGPRDAAGFLASLPSAVLAATLLRDAGTASTRPQPASSIERRRDELEHRGLIEHD